MEITLKFRDVKVGEILLVSNPYTNAGHICKIISLNISKSHLVLKVIKSNYCPIGTVFPTYFNLNRMQKLNPIIVKLLYE